MPETKRIVLLTDALIDPHAGGAERKIYELAEMLDKEKFKVYLCSLDCEGTGSEDLAKKYGCELHKFRVKRIYGLSGFLQGIKFIRFLRREKIDILQTYHFSSDIWGTFYGHLAGVKTIISNRRDMGFWRKPIHTKAYRWLNGWVKKVVVVAEAVKQQYIQLEGIPEDKFEVIYNGVKLIDNFKVGVENLKIELDIKPQDCVIVHVANFKQVKGHIYLFESLEVLNSKYPNLKCLLVGEDEFDGKFQRIVEKKGLKDKVVFLGKRSDVRALLELADIAVLPSLSEGMSNAILEYMEAGKPIVATDVGGNSETIVDQENGFLVEPKNVQELANALEKLIIDPQLISEMGRKSRQRAETIFSLDTMISKYESLFLGC